MAAQKEKINSDKNKIPGAENKSVEWWKSKSAKITGWIVGIVIIAGFFIWIFFFRPYVSTDDARVAATIVRVANQGVSARIEKVNVAEGDNVANGTILVELDHRIAEAQYSRAKARARFTGLELRRAKDLAAQRGISQRELDRISADAQIADSEESLAEIALENTYLKSPANGIVVQKPAEVGNILESNQTAVTIVDIEHAWISANIEETSVGLVHPGQKVRITVDEGGSLTGKVLEVRKAAAAQFALIPSDNAAGNFTKLVQRIPIKIALDPHPGRILRVGESVEIRIRVR